MLFNSWTFVGLVLVTFGLYYCPGLRRWQFHVLIGASFIFYAYEQPVLLLLLLTSIGINAVTSYQVAAQPSARRFWAVAGVTLNLGLLLFFKYSPLFARTLLGDVNSPESVGHFLVTIPLPIGISFFTFQGISLVVEVFRKCGGKERDGGASWQPAVASGFWAHLEKTALFKSFFPQLIAGPIVKAQEFYPQIEGKRFGAIDWEATFRALVVGYFLKMVVADNLADLTYWLQYPFFLELSRWSLAALLTAFSLQIFADFAGYSLIAIGLGHLFGYRLPTNFNYPYLAASFSEFWRRWHISLSTWLREYLYIPLGGNQKGAARTYFNLFVVMFLGGLWHGAAWSYAIWGTFHGLALAAERLLRNWVRPPRTWWMQILRVGIVFSFVTVAWLLFKLPQFAHVVAFFSAFASNAGQTQHRQFVWLTVWSLPVVLYYAWHLFKHNRRTAGISQRYEFLLFGAMLMGIVLNSGLQTRFIYFQF